MRPIINIQKANAVYVPLVLSICKRKSVEFVIGLGGQHTNPFYVIIKEDIVTEQMQQKCESTGEIPRNSLTTA